MYSQAFDINPDFYSLTDEEKNILKFLFFAKDMIKTVAKTCTSKDILDRRRRFLYK